MAAPAARSIIAIFYIGAGIAHDGRFRR